MVAVLAGRQLVAVGYRRIDTCSLLLAVLLLVLLAFQPGAGHGNTSACPQGNGGVLHCELSAVAAILLAADHNTGREKDEMKMGINLERKRWIAIMEYFLHQWQQHGQALAVFGTRSFDRYRQQLVPVQVIYNGLCHTAVMK